MTDGRDRRPLRHITRDLLEPVWRRRDIPVSRIASRLGVSRQAVHAKAMSLGLPPRGKGTQPGRRCSDEEFIRMWEAGVECRGFMEAFGYKRSDCVTRRRRNLGLDPRKCVSGRANNGWGTITLKQYREQQMGEMLRDAMMAGDR